MIESGFTASPETNQKKPPEIDSPSLSRQPAGPGSLRTGESCFFLVVVAALGGGAAALFAGYKRPLLAIHSQQIGDHLAGHG